MIISVSYSGEGIRSCGREKVEKERGEVLLEKKKLKIYIWYIWYYVYIIMKIVCVNICRFIYKIK